MDIKQQIQKDLKEAMKNRREIEVGALRMLLAALVNKEKERGTPIGEEQVQTVLWGEAKKRKEAAEAFEKGGRPDRAAKEREELGIVKRYLSPEMSKEDLRNLVKEAIAKTGATSSKDRGKVMAAVMPQVRGKADGSLVSSIVKELLG